jgi:transcription initiation factor TFIID subunit TAF12
MPDGLSERAAKGTTGGGEPLDSSARNSPPKPKISNLSVPGVDGQDKLTEEQRKEVDKHNKEFEDRHDRGNSAADDKVDKKFWSTERGTD